MRTFCSPSWFSIPSPLSMVSPTKPLSVVVGTFWGDAVGVVSSSCIVPLFGLSVLQPAGVLFPVFNGRAVFPVIVLAGRLCI